MPDARERVFERCEVRLASDERYRRSSNATAGPGTRTEGRDEMKSTICWPDGRSSASRRSSLVQICSRASGTSGLRSRGDGPSPGELRVENGL